MPDFPGGEPGFVEELRTPKARKIRWNTRKEPGKDELDLRNGLSFHTYFPDPESLLESALLDFSRFLGENGIACTRGVSVKLLQDKELSGEDFALTITKSGILLEAGTTEGARRGLYRLIARLREPDHPGIALQERRITRYWLKDRISRCFFSPIKRAPFFRDELLDDRDYYPEAYLSRLAESGVNGLWITVVLKEFQNDSDGQRRVKKLNRVIARCRKYGIKIWAFCIEPENWSDVHCAPSPELVGPSVYGRWNAVCMKSEAAEKLVYEAVNRLFTLAPGLGGMITISHGERVTSCLSCRSLYSDGRLPCSEDCGLTPPDVLHKVLAAMVRGMKEASPEARLVSWLYTPHPDQVAEWYYQLPSGVPEDVILMSNFESGCRARQLGRLRNGGDYWLSTAGPGERFSRLAELRRPWPMGAKLQVGCSHECATVPFIPVPGQLYRKYREMKKLSVVLVMQCWYFGNYPGLMNDAAGLLATEEAVELGEQEFLTALARPDWGVHAEKAAAIWNTFAAAYENYPLEILFQYYGPMHDGPVWPLYPVPVKRSLPASWRPFREPAGDDIGECLAGHTVDEAAALTGRMAELWHKGTEAFARLMEHFPEDRERKRDFSLVKALDIQFDSGHNILSFYALRRYWLKGKNPFYEKRMRSIIAREIENSGKLKILCREDPRLGYHSEAEVFKYFPEKLEWRIWLLRELEEKDFPCPEKEPVLFPGTEYRAASFVWRWTADEENLCFVIDVSGAPKPDEVLRFFFTDEEFITYPWFDLVIRRDNRPPDDNMEHQTLQHPPENAIRDWRQIATARSAECGNSWHVELTVPWGTVQYAPRFRFGIQHDRVKQWGAVGAGEILGNYPLGNYHQEDRLYLGFYAPEKTVLLSPGGNESLKP